MTPTPTITDDFQLPVVDFSPFLVDEGAVVGEEPTTAQLDTAKAINEAGIHHGFVCLQNCGVDKNTLSSAFEASENLFHLSKKEKSQLKRLNVKDNTGYAPFGAESLNRQRRADMKESYNVRTSGNDYSGTPKGFSDAATSLWDNVRDASRRYAICCALALGLPLDCFSKTIDSMNQCTLRMLHYPPVIDMNETDEKVDNETAVVKEAIRIGEHTDFGLFTFLFVRNHEMACSQGLQVKAVEGGDLSIGCASSVKDDTSLDEGWKNVVLDEATLAASMNDETALAIVNTGALFARITNDVWRATAHRVIVKPEAMTLPRFSIACFIDPDKETLCEVHEKYVPCGEAPKYASITSLEYLQMKLREAQEKD